MYFSYFLYFVFLYFVFCYHILQQQIVGGAKFVANTERPFVLQDLCNIFFFICASTFYFVYAIYPLIFVQHFFLYLYIIFFFICASTFSFVYAISPLYFCNTFFFICENIFSLFVQHFSSLFVQYLFFNCATLLPLFVQRLFLCLCNTFFTGYKFDIFNVQCFQRTRRCSQRGNTALRASRPPWSPSSTLRLPGSARTWSACTWKLSIYGLFSHIVPPYQVYDQILYHKLYLHISPSAPCGWKLSIFKAFLTRFPSCREYSDLPK